MVTDSLVEDKLERFRQEYSIARSLTPVEPGSHGPQKIADVISSSIRRLSRTASVTFNQGLILIEGHQGDGISWACQQASDSIRQRHSNWYVAVLDGSISKEEQKLPEIVTAIGMNSAIRACRSVKLLPSRLASIRSHPIVLLVIAITLTLLGSFIVKLVDKLINTPSLANLSWYEWGGISIAAILACLSAYLINQVKFPNKKDIEESVSRIFSEDSRHPPATQRHLIHEVTRAYVNLEMPRCIIIDDFAKLDPFTQQCIIHAFTESNLGGIGSLLWVVFETHETPLIGRRIAVDPQMSLNFTPRMQVENEAPRPPSEHERHRGIHSYRLELTEEAERRMLARSLGLPESRAIEYPFLKNLVRGISTDELRELEGIWRNFLTLHSNDEGAELLRVIASNSRYPEFALDRDEYHSLFSRQSGLFNELIRGDRPFLYLTEVRELLTLLQSRLPSLFVPGNGSTATLRIKPDVYDAVKPPQEATQTRIHLFWLLHWDRQYRGKSRSVRFEHMLLDHAREISTLSPILRESGGAAIVEEYVGALSQAVTDCLDMTLMQEAVQLTKKLLIALEALTEFQLADDGLLTRVWRDILVTCWRVHIVTRSEEMLESLFNLLANLATKKGIPPLQGSDIDDALQYLGITGISEETARYALAAKKRIGGADQVVFDKALTYLSIAWTELLYFLTRAFDGSRLSECGIVPYERKAVSLLDSIDLDAYDEATIQTQQDFKILNHEIVNLINFASARSGQCHNPYELFFRIMAFAGSSQGRAEEAARDHSSIPLLEQALRLDALACCLDAALEVIRLGQERRGRPSYYNPTPDRGYAFRSDIIAGHLAPTLNDIFEESFVHILKDESYPHIDEHSPLPNDLLQKIEDLYLRAAIVWERFGLPELRDRALVHRADFVLRVSNADPHAGETFEELLKSLSAPLPSPTPTGLAANLQLADFFAPITDLSTMYFLEVACRLWERPHQISLMAAAAEAAIAHAIRPTGPNVARLASLLLQRLGDDKILGPLSEIADGRSLTWILGFVLQVLLLLGDDELLAQARAVAERALRASLVPDHNIQVIRDELSVADFTYRVKRETALNPLDLTAEWLGTFSNGTTVSQLFCWLIEYHHNLPAEVYLQGLHHLESRHLPFLAHDTLLGMELIRYFATHSDVPHLSQVVSLVKKWALSGEAQLPLERAMQLRALLKEHDVANRPQHEHAYLVYFQAWANRQQVESLLYFIKKGHYFYTVEQYYRMLSPLGLAVDSGSFPVDTLRDMPIEQVIAEFRRLQGGILRLVREVNGLQVISRDFFTFGRRFFDASQAQHPDLEELRGLFDRESQAELAKFFDVTINSADIPASLRDILRQHSEILMQH